MSESGKPEALSQFYDQLEAATQDPTAPKFNAALNTGANWLLAQTSQEHWFCSKDSSDEAYFRDLYEVATFCLRLCEFKVSARQSPSRTINGSRAPLFLSIGPADEELCVRLEERLGSVSLELLPLRDWLCESKAYTRGQVSTR